jgi:Spy/CpxP family protein refolding chaperone
MNKLRFLSIIAVLLLVLNGGTLIYLLREQGMEDRPPHPGNDAADFIIEKLQLDDQQQQQFAGLRQQHRNTIHEAQDEDRRLHDLYFSLLKTDSPDKATVDSVSALMANQRSIIETATFTHFQQLRKLCREDQKKHFDMIINEIARRIGGPKGPPPPPGRPPHD